ncbi:hypothetical protein MTO96_017371 [Rhipicephalus appendiculatus]
MDASATGDTSHEDSPAAGADLSGDNRAPQSAQPMPPLATLDPEATEVVRSPVAGALEDESAVTIPLCTMLFVAFGVGAGIVLASFGVLLLWYHLLPEPEKILLTAVPRARGVGAAADVVSATTNAGTPAAVDIVQYVGVPQTYLPDNWNRSSDASFPVMNSSSYDVSLVEMETRENSTNASMLLEPL